MTQKEIPKELLDQLIQCANVYEALARANEYIKLIDQGKISDSEFKNLMEDIQHTVNIHEHLLEASVLIKINAVINGIIVAICASI